MTLGEVKRAIESKLRVDKIRAKERATFDYILAELIGVSVGRFMSGSSDYPSLEQVYPSLFTDETKAKESERQAKRDELSALRFKQFAQSYNERHTKEVAKLSE